MEALASTADAVVALIKRETRVSSKGSRGGGIDIDFEYDFRVNKEVHSTGTGEIWDLKLFSFSSSKFQSLFECW